MKKRTTVNRDTRGTAGHSGNAKTYSAARTLNDLHLRLPKLCVKQVPKIVEKHGRNVRVLGDRKADQAVAPELMRMLKTCDCVVVKAGVEVEISDWPDVVFVLWSGRGAIVKQRYMAKCFYVEGIG